MDYFHSDAINRCCVIVKQGSHLISDIKIINGRRSRRTCLDDDVHINIILNYRKNIKPCVF
jgi:hypothetical protein